MTLKDVEQLFLVCHNVVECNASARDSHEATEIHRTDERRDSLATRSAS
jgi:hypothetical protein